MRGVEEQEGAVGLGVDREERGEEFWEGKAGGEDYESAVWVFEEVGDYLFVEFQDHFRVRAWREREGRGNWGRRRKRTCGFLS